MIEEIIALLQANDQVCDSEVQQWVEEDAATFLRIKVALKDGTQLFIKELFSPGGSKYSYHWQTSEGKLLCRWDNAPHWSDIPTFPHHRHIAEEVLPSHRVGIGEVLTEIQRLSDSTNE